LEQQYEQVAVFHGFFSPCSFNKYLFIDGGALNNIPVDEVIKQGADFTMAVKFRSDPVDTNSNVMDITMKAIDIMGTKISEKGLNQSDYILEVYTDKVGLLDIKKLDKCYEYGYEAVIEKIEEIKSLINKKQNEIKLYEKNNK
jgi:predicted acylesterase/phospholipase RssA